MLVEQSSARQMTRASGQRAFGTDASGYHAARLGYPDALFDDIFARARPSPKILEIGAGTGLATQSLLNRNPRAVTAIESDPVLAEYLRDHLGDPRLTISNANFPDAPTDGDFDLIVCAAAFHWMEPQAALARIRQLLCPEGIWAMWWNAYRNPTHDPLAQAITPLLADLALPPSEAPEGHYSLDVTFHTEVLMAAGFRDVRHTCYRRERMLNAREVRELYSSYSYVRALPEDRRIRLMDDISRLVERQFGGVAPNVVLTNVYSASLD